MGDVAAFLQWLKEQLSSRKNPFYYYALRLRNDLQAVRNALLSPYSNGLLEDQFNRLKTIKRMTYGRARLEILENGYSINCKYYSENKNNKNYLYLT
ncbi:transposase [Bacillus sp. 03113]|uniref:transposase n=1 Tax=Bacillus sp. 03113 TaxID=2578211 RepID=UPI00215C1D20|nr:transposase [Bacillus sp. 03113]